MDLYTVRNNLLKGISINDMNLRVVFYARVSTDKDEQIHSLKAQVDFFTEYISKNPNWIYINSYVDEGISGTSSLKRESFLQMIKDAKKNKFDLVLTKEISRFSRNTLDSIKYTEELLLSGVGVYFLNDNINTILPDSELRLTIMASVAQDEVRKLSQRVSFGMKRSINNGVVLGSSNIYGYEKDNGKLIINEEEAMMIKIIYDKYANTNISLSKLSKYLFEKGYKTKTGKRFDTTALARIISNPKYKGYYCGNKSKVLDYRTKRKKRLDDKEWVIYKNEEKVPKIVDEILWNIANEKLKLRKESISNKIVDKKIFENRYTYSGKIYCKKHDVTYHRNSAGKRKKNPVWECQMYRKEGVKGCLNSRIIEQELDDALGKYFKKYYQENSNIFDDLLNECSTFLYLNNNESKIKQLNNKCKVINNKKDKLLELVMDGYLDNNEYKRQIDALNCELLYYKNDLSKLKKDKKDKSQIEEKLMKIKDALEKSMDDKKCFSDTFSKMVDKIYVYDDTINRKKVRLEIILKSKQIKFIESDNLGKKYHFIESYTTSYSG